MNYLFQSSLCIITFYVFYLILLKGDKMFNIQRVYLIGALALSILIPLIGIIWDSSLPENNTIPFINGSFVIIDQVSSATIAQESTFNWSWSYTFTSVYFLGVIYFAWRFSTRLYTILKTISTGEIQKEGNYQIVLTEKNTPLASFYHFIFLNKSHLKNKDINLILTHEKKHVDDLHTIDVLITEVFKIFFWFNPIIYFYSQSIKAVHEFICDEAVVKQNSLTQYEQVLIHSFFQKANLSLLSQFNEISIKNRINMMNKSKSKGFFSKVKSFKTSLAIPVILLLVLACNQENLPTVSERMISGVITNSEGKALPGTNIVAAGTEIGTISDLQGRYKLTVPGSIQSLTFSFIGFHSQEISIEKNPAINVTLIADPEADLTPPEPNFQVSTVYSNVGEKSVMSGKVFDLDGEPLEDIKIIQYTKNKEKIINTSGSNGEYSIELINDSRFVIFQKSKEEIVVKMAKETFKD